jgi:hypothetical protein
MLKNDVNNVLCLKESLHPEVEKKVGYMVYYKSIKVNYWNYTALEYNCNYTLYLIRYRIYLNLKTYLYMVKFLEFCEFNSFI